MKTILDTNRALLQQFLERHSDLDYFWPEYGTIVFPRLKFGNVNEFCRLLRDEFETSIVPGEFFELPSHFRVGVGATTAEVKEALQKLGHGLDRYKASLTVQV